MSTSRLQSLMSRHNKNQRSSTSSTTPLIIPTSHSLSSLTSLSHRSVKAQPRKKATVKAVLGIHTTSLVKFSLQLETGLSLRNFTQLAEEMLSATLEAKLGIRESAIQWRAHAIHMKDIRDSLQRQHLMEGTGEEDSNVDLKEVLSWRMVDGEIEKAKLVELEKIWEAYCRLISKLNGNVEVKVVFQANIFAWTKKDVVEDVITGQGEIGDKLEVKSFYGTGNEDGGDVTFCDKDPKVELCSEERDQVNMG